MAVVVELRGGDKGCRGGVGCGGLRLGVQQRLGVDAAEEMLMGGSWCAAVKIGRGRSG